MISSCEVDVEERVLAFSIT